MMSIKEIIIAMENIMAKAVKVTFSDSYQAKMKRIKRLPQFMGRAVSGYTKRDILAINKIFHDGILNNTLRLDKLAEITIDSKRRQGFSRPSSPLYGKGDDAENRSYANMLNITKRGDAWTLRPSTRMHWSGKIKLSDLFKIHEYGALIRKTKKNGESSLIRIPPRPALLISYRRFLIQKRQNKKEQSKEVKKAMTEYINTASEKKLRGLAAWEKSENSNR